MAGTRTLVGAGGLTLAMMVIGLAGCGDDSSASSDTAGGFAGSTTVAAAPTGGEADRLVTESAGSLLSDLPLTPLPAAGTAQIRTAVVSIRVAAGSLTDRIGRVGDIVGGLGGFVAQSSLAATGTAGDPAGGSVEDRSHTRDGGTAELVTRVPSARFDDARSAFGALGEVIEESFTGSDVSGQLVDLQARITSLSLQEDAYRKIFEQASTIQDILAVQQPLSEVRTQIEQLQAQQSGLKDQVAMSTITVRLAEPGAAAEGGVDHESRWVRAWHNAVNALSATGAAILVVLVVAGPFAAVAALVLAVLWRRRRRVRAFAAGEGTAVAERTAVAAESGDATH